MPRRQKSASALSPFQRRVSAALSIRGQAIPSLAGHRSPLELGNNRILHMLCHNSKRKLDFVALLLPFSLQVYIQQFILIAVYPETTELLAKIMEIFNLPFPALQCVIEHMAAAAGIYRATRLRLVCSMCHRIMQAYPDVSNADRFIIEFFDEEVKRIIFGSRIFNFDTDTRYESNRHSMVEYLKARTIRTHIFMPTALTSTIRTAAELLLEDIKSEKNLSLQRKLYQEKLCEAVVDTIQYHEIKSVVKERPSLSADQLELPVHMLAAAAAVGNTRLVQNLLSTNPGTSIRSLFFGCALTNAARIGRDDIVSLLLKSFDQSSETEDPPNPTVSAVITPGSKQDSIATALAVACEHGYDTIVEMLSGHTHQFHQFSDSVVTDALVAAAYNGHLRIVQWLLEAAGFSSKDKVLSKLMLASCSGGHTDLVETLLNSGANINSWRADGHSCLCMAAERGHFGVIKLLMSRSVRWTDFPRGDALCLAAMDGHEDIVQLFLDSGIYYGGEDTLGRALVRAAYHGETRMVQFLIQKGVNLDKPGVGRTALYRAAERGFDDTVSLLAKHGVPLNDCEFTGEPMLFALIYGQYHVVRLLLELGAAPVDPLKTRFAEHFMEGEFPRKPFKLCSIH